jgi:hypothetical protein
METFLKLGPELEDELEDNTSKISTHRENR